MVNLINHRLILQWNGSNGFKQVSLFIDKYDAKKGKSIFWNNRLIYYQNGCREENELNVKNFIWDW